MRYTLSRFLILVLCLLLLSAPAGAGLLIDCTSDEEEPSCDKCTGDLTFSWHMEGENNTERLDVTKGTPPLCGCSQGDTTASLNSSATFSTSQFHDGAASLYAPGSLDYASFESNGIISSSASTVEFWVRIEDWASDNPMLFLYQYNGDNTYRIMEYGSGPNNIEFRIYYDAGTQAAAHIATSAVNGVEGQWYRIVAKQRAGSTDPSLMLSVYNEEGELLDQVASNADLQTFSTEGSSFSLGCAMYTTADEPLNIDEVKIWDAWRD